MAIKQSYTTDAFGVTAPDAYIKVDNFRGNINEVHFQALIYANETARVTGKQPIDGFNFVMPYSDGMTYNLVYTYLKTLPGFENAVDC